MELSVREAVCTLDECRRLAVGDECVRPFVHCDARLGCVEEPQLPTCGGPACEVLPTPAHATRPVEFHVLVEASTSVHENVTALLERAVRGVATWSPSARARVSVSVFGQKKQKKQKNKGKAKRKSDLQLVVVQPLTSCVDCVAEVLAELRLASAAVEALEPRLTLQAVRRLLHKSAAGDVRANAHQHVLVVKGSGSVEETDSAREDRALERAVATIAEKRASVHLWMDGANWQDVELFGLPKLDNAYANCRSFSKGATLVNILDHSNKVLSSGLQAHLISRGLECRLKDVQTLDGDCAARLFDVDTAADVLPLCDACVTLACRAASGECERTAVDCPTGPCDPVLGCAEVDGIAGADGQAGISDTSLLHVQRYERSEDVADELDPPQPVKVVMWDKETPFAAFAINGGLPVILRNTSVSDWPALQTWSFEHLRDSLVEHNVSALQDVKHGRPGLARHLFFDPDSRAPMWSLYENSTVLPYDVAEELDTVELFDRVAASTSNSEVEDPSAADDDLLYFFGDMSQTPTLIRDIQPRRHLFLTDDDMNKAKNFIWVSSKGVRMHWHFDQDHNMFVQLVGRKRFTLASPSDHRDMYIFPRVHPMWHKSQVEFSRGRSSAAFPNYARVPRFEALLEPGDVMYLPPYWWHTVDALTPSVSLSSWSHDKPMYDAMEAVYKSDHKIDMLGNSTGKMYALRLYLDLLIQKVHGRNETARFVRNFLSTRYRHVMSDPELRRDAHAREPLCPLDAKVPTAQHVYGDATLDERIFSQHFLTLSSPEKRDILLDDYIEELAAQVVGADRVVDFFRECFRGQGYRMTSMDDEEHDMWD